MIEVAKFVKLKSIFSAEDKAKNEFLRLKRELSKRDLLRLTKMLNDAVLK